MEYMTTNQTAAYLKLSVGKLKKWRLSGQGPAFLRIGRMVRYRKADLDAFMDRLKAGA